jgi:hypothetical protein
VYRKLKTRSKVSNGSELLPGVDGRSTWCRRARDVLEAHIQDLAGYDHTSEAERSICRRAAVLTTELERLEVRFATSQDTEPELVDLYARAASSLRRLLEAVGLQRRARDVTPPDLSEYLASRTVDPVVEAELDDDDADTEEEAGGAPHRTQRHLGEASAPPASDVRRAAETNPASPQRVAGRPRPRPVLSVTISSGRPGP